MAFLSFLAASLLFFDKQFFGLYIFCYRDLTHLYYPVRWFASQLVRSGILPLWNPHLSMGFPLSATLVSGVFYPLSLVYYILPFDLAFNWFIILHYLLAAYFMYLFCRELKFSKEAAFAAGLVFAFSGYALAILDLLNMLAALAWLPLAFLFFRRVLRPEGRAADVVWTAVVLTVMFLAGSPAILYGTVWLLFGYILWAQFGRWRSAGRAVLMLFLAGLLMTLLSAFQLLPFLELLAHTTRAAGGSFVEVTTFALEPAELVNFIVPRSGNGLIAYFYVGPLAFGLALLGLFLRKDKRAWWLAGLICLSVLVMLGPKTPLYSLLYKLVPGFSFFRYPVKFAFIPVFVLALLAGRGIDLLWLRLGQRLRLSRQAFSSALALLVLLNLYFAGRDVSFSAPVNSYLDEPVNVQALKADKSLFRYFTRGELHLRSFNDATSLFALRSRLAPNQNMLYGFDALDGYAPLVGKDQQKLYACLFAGDLDMDHRLLDMLNVKYVICPGRINGRNYLLLNREKEVRGGGAVWLYRNLNVLPRAFIAPKGRVFADREELLRYMFSPRFDPEKEVLFDSDQGPAGGKGKVKILLYAANEVKIETNTNGAAFLSLSDWDYPGWKAYLDGRKVEILRANYMFRAVKVPPGEHLVRFVYDPWTFKLGALISFLALLLVILLIGPAVKRWR